MGGIVGGCHMGGCHMGGRFGLYLFLPLEPAPRPPAPSHSTASPQHHSRMGRGGLQALVAAHASKVSVTPAFMAELVAAVEGLRDGKRPVVEASASGGLLGWRWLDALIKGPRPWERLFAVYKAALGRMGYDMVLATVSAFARCRGARWGGPGGRSGPVGWTRDLAAGRRRPRSWTRSLAAGRRRPPSWTAGPAGGLRGGVQLGGSTPGSGTSNGPGKRKTTWPQGTVMAWCPNCQTEGGKGKSHNQFAHLGGGYCGRYSLPLAKR
jgi:hypothetical protein